MFDLVRHGLAGVENKTDAFWEDQAARMVDAQAPGIAYLLRDITRCRCTNPIGPTCCWQS